MTVSCYPPHLTLGTSCQVLLVGRTPEVHCRIERHDASRVHPALAAVVASFDLHQVHSSRQAG